MLVGAGVVDSVAEPDVFVVVDVPYQHAFASEIGIPALLTPVFEEEKFVIGISLDKIGGIGIGKRFERIFAGTVDYFWLQPSERHAFER